MMIIAQPLRGRNLKDEKGNAGQSKHPKEVIYACVHSGTKANSMGRIRASAEVEKVVLEKNGESGMGTWKAMVLKDEKD